MPGRNKAAAVDLPDPAGFSELRARIVARYPQLSQQLKSIAEFALATPETMAMETAVQLAARLDVQPSSLVRFAQALDYRGFNEMKRAFRAHLIFKLADARDQAAAARQPKLGPQGILQSILEESRAELAALADRADVDLFTRAAQSLARADRIYVTAQHVGYPFASLFAWTLLRSGVACHLLDNVGGFALRQSELAMAGDALLAISFAPYQPSVVQAARAHADRGGTVVGLSDTPLSPLAPFVRILLEVPHHEPAAGRSLVAPTCLLQALAMAVVQDRAGQPG
ncbi:MAG: MurR/RpiR family transcriptional regulator [Alphaproteobacteria bacterium]